MNQTIPWICLLAFTWICGTTYIHQHENCPCLIANTSAIETGTHTSPNNSDSKVVTHALGLVPGTGGSLVGNNNDHTFISVKKEKVPEVIQFVSQQKMVLYFATNSWDLLWSADQLQQLEDWIRHLQTHPSANIEVSGHTDNLGEEKLNQRISRKRAEFVRDFLLEKGIPNRQIQAVGTGADQPLHSNRFSSGRAKNRRVEIEIRP